MLSKTKITMLYQKQGLSVAQIAQRLKCSQGRVDYWLKKYGIQKRSISEAAYRKHNPSGDPFSIHVPRSLRDATLFGLGIGLYWGEGTKTNKNSLRLANSDPALIRVFMDFLVLLYGVDRKRLRFGLQIFGDMSKKETMRFWMRYLNVSREQFYPSIVVTPYRGVGTYRNKTRYGVVTLYFNNTKLRDTICRAIEQIANKSSKPM